MQPIVESTSTSGVLDQFSAVIVALFGLAIALAQAILPWTPLLLWIAFWLFAVNWLNPVLMRGGLVGVVLISVVAILVWGSISEPVGGSHSLFGLSVNNLVGKAVYVIGLSVIAFLCGTVQLSGGCGAWCQFEDETPDSLPAEPHAHH